MHPRKKSEKDFQSLKSGNKIGKEAKYPKNDRKPDIIEDSLWII